MDAARLGAGDFLADLAHQRVASPHTVAAYRRDLAALAGLAGERPLAALDQAQLRIAADPCDGLRAPKQARTLPKALAVDQVAALLDAAAEDDLETRDKAMFELIYSSGLRLSELAGLDVDGVDFADGTVTVTGKRAKTRTVPVGAKAAAALREWLDERASLAAAGERALFVGRRGARLARRSIERRLERWATKQGLGLHVHPHMLRHSFASHVLQSSGDLRAVQEMLGHSNISTTQIYTHLDFQHLAKAYDAAHPRARKK